MTLFSYKKIQRPFFGASFFFFCFLPALYAEHPEDWQKIRQPIQGKATPIGQYTNGCLIGAKALPFEGIGYQVVRREKYRFFAHPDMFDYLQNLGKKVHRANLPTMLISDIAMPAGGRFVSGHRSHQMGLDADIWFKMGQLSTQEAEHSTGLAHLMVNSGSNKVNAHWSKAQATLLKLAASDKKVARIFVHPAIKIHLCETEKGDRHWLNKIRPWFGHNSHFHVRLHCPKGAKYCENQPPIPKGDGCDASLYAWLKAKPSKPSAPQKIVIPPPPPLCQLLLEQHVK